MRLLVFTLFVGIVSAQQPMQRTIIRTLKPTALPRALDLNNADFETTEKARAMLRSSRNATNQSEPDAAMAFDSENGLVLAVPVRDEFGRFLREEGESRTAMFDVITGEGHAINIDATADITTGGITKLIVRDSRTQEGLEFNYREGRLYSLATNNSGIGNYVSCVITELGTLAKPCEAAMLAANVASCIASIIALPGTVGISAIIALPTCGALLGDLEKSLACAGFDCGVQSAIDQSKAVTPKWLIQPPTNVFGGLAFGVAWQLADGGSLQGVPVTSSRVIASTSSTPQSAPLFVTTTYGGGTINAGQVLNYTGSISLPLANFAAPGSKMNFVIEAVSSGVYYYSPVVSSVITNPPQPSIAAISPNPVSGFNGTQTITITGANFYSGATVSWQSGATSGTLLPTSVTFVDAKTMRASMNFTNTTATWQIRVNNPSSAGGVSSGWFQLKVQKK